MLLFYEEEKPWDGYLLHPIYKQHLFFFFHLSDRKKKKEKKQKLVRKTSWVDSIAARNSILKQAILIKNDQIEVSYVF